MSKRQVRLGRRSKSSEKVRWRELLHGVWWMASTTRSFALTLLLASASAQASAPLDDALKSDPVALGPFEQVRTLRAKRRNVDIILFDPGPASSRSSRARDLAMADGLRSETADLPRGCLLVHAGNVHSMLECPSSLPPEMQTPIGSRLRDLDPYSVNITANGGAFRAHAPTCEAQTMSKSTRTSVLAKPPPSVQLSAIPFKPAANRSGPLPTFRQCLSGSGGR